MCLIQRTTAKTIKNFFFFLNSETVVQNMKSVYWAAPEKTNRKEMYLKENKVKQCI